MLDKIALVNFFILFKKDEFYIIVKNHTFILKIEFFLLFQVK